MFNLFPTAGLAVSGLLTTLANTVSHAINDATAHSIENIRETLEAKGLLTAEVDEVLMAAMAVGAAHHVVSVPGVPKTRSYAGATETVVAEETKPVKVRKPRTPTFYNNYIQAKIAELKQTRTDLIGKQFMQVAIEHWNADKAAGKIPVKVVAETPVDGEPVEKKRRGRPPKNAAVATA